MNNLSWFLYFAGTLPQVAFAIAVLSFILTAIFGFIFIAYLCCKNSSDASERDLAETLKPYRNMWAVCMFLHVTTFLVPAKETFYAIAASEMGEEVLNSKVGNKAQKALESWLDKQIKTSSEKEETNGE